MNFRNYITFLFLILNIGTSAQIVEWTQVADSVGWHGPTIVTSQNEIITVRFNSDSMQLMRFNNLGNILWEGKVNRNSFLSNIHLIEGGDDELFILEQRGILHRFTFSTMQLDQILDLTNDNDYNIIRNIIKIGSKVIFTGEGAKESGTQILNGAIDLSSLDYSSILIDQEGYSSGLSYNETNNQIFETRSRSGIHQILVSDEFGVVLSDNEIQWSGEELYIADILYVNNEILLAGSKGFSPNPTIGILMSVTNQGEINWVKEFEPDNDENYLGFEAIQTYNGKIYLAGRKGLFDLTDVYLVAVNGQKEIDFELELDLTYQSESIFELDVLDNGGIVATGTLDFTDYLGTEKAFTMLIRDLISNSKDISKESILLYPNPTSSMLSIELTQDVDAKLHYQIVAMNGTFVLSGEINGPNLKIDLNQLASGNYFVILTDENGKVVYQEKIVKVESEQ